MNHISVLLAALIFTSLATLQATAPPNALFIAVDDLNDWVGSLGGNPQVITPNLDRLAKEHAIVMNKA